MAGRKPSWTDSAKSHIIVFNVGRGLSVFIRTPLNQGIVYDFGSSEDFAPSEFMKVRLLPFLDGYKDKPVAQRFVSHPHADHLTDIGCVKDPDEERSPFNAALHTCPHDKSGAAQPEALDWDRIKNPGGSEDNVEIYKSLYARRALPLQTIQYDSTRSAMNVEYGLYYVRPPVVAGLFPTDDQEYGNGTSLVVYYRHSIHSILLTGDINPDTLKRILEERTGLEKRYTVFERSWAATYPHWHDVTGNQPALKRLLGDNGLSILLAPHHGLESGFSEDLYKAIKGGKPGLVAISEKRHKKDTDGTVHPKYRTSDGAVGQYVSIEGKVEKRYSVSTQSGHHMLFQFQRASGQPPEVYLEKDPERLVARMS